MPVISSSSFIQQTRFSFLCYKNKKISDGLLDGYEDDCGNIQNGCSTARILDSYKILLIH